MIKFSDYNEIKEMYDTQKYDIFYESGSTKYEVAHLGSTIYCRNVEKGMGMGAITNFPIDKFYAVEKPVVVEPEPTVTVDSSTDVVDSSVSSN